MELELLNINKYFNEFHVLKDVTFKVRSGQIFGFLGRNGAGKTTSIRILMDVFEADSGDIFLDGQVFRPGNYRIGYLPEERGMYAKTKVMDQLVYFSMLRGATHKKAIDTVLYWTERFEISEYLKRPLETLSKGNQQKVQIAQAFLNEPDILILDEPFSGLDPVNSKVFQDALAEFISDERIIIFSSHQMSYVESFCDEIAIIDHGEIVLNGSLKDIKRGMGENKLRIAANNLSPQQLFDVMKEAGNEAIIDHQSVVVQMSHPDQKNQLIQTLIQNSIDIHQVMDYEPSLQDIFVSTVGGETHD